jgi:hypothetical protein
MTVTLGFAITVALLGGRADRLQTWAASAAQEPIELVRGLSEAELMHLAAAAAASTILTSRNHPERLGTALELYPLSLRGRPAPPLSFSQLADFPVEALSDQQRGVLRFLAGQALLAIGDPVAAIDQLRRTPPGSPAFAPARVLLGIAVLTPPFSDRVAAAAAFEAAIRETEDTSPAFAELQAESRRLATLQLARLAYDTGQFEVADYYYHLIPASAPERTEAAFESAWSLVLRGEMERALGAIHAARSPRLLHPDSLELEIVAAAAHLALCRFEEARVDLDAIERTAEVSVESVRRAAHAVSEPGAVAHLRRYLGDSERLSPPMREWLFRMPAVAAAIRDGDELMAERARLGGMGLPPDGDHAIDGLVQGLSATYEARLDAALQAGLRRMLVTLDRAIAARSELMIDLLERQERLLGQALAGHTLQPVIAAPAPALGENWQIWAFDGEVYTDELPWYRAESPAHCSEED